MDYTPRAMPPGNCFLQNLFRRYLNNDVLNLRLGPITFGPPKKVWTAGTRDRQPYVTFEFLYRSRGTILFFEGSLHFTNTPSSELITEALPDEGWELAAGPWNNAAFEKKELPSPLRRGRTRHDGADSSHPPTTFPPPSGGKSSSVSLFKCYRVHTTYLVGANLVKRPSITNRAKKWASDVKQSTQSIRLARNRGSQSVSRVLCFLYWMDPQPTLKLLHPFRK